MLSAEDLNQLRRKIERIEGELAEARAVLARFEQERTPPPAPVPTAVAETPPDPVVAPPPLPVEPPLLAAPPPVAPPTPPLPSPANQPVREWLEQVHLWPPSGEGNTEVRMAAWWTTRLGALLAVIGVVFFGIYISRDTTPLLKLAELAAAALAVWGIGAWLERTVPKFGAVLVGAGLALVYFTAVAAHAVPATRVIADPLLAGAVQLAAVALIGGLALRRASEATAVMAIVLGLVTAGMAVPAGLGWFPPWSVGLLAAAAVALRFRPGWRAPSIVAVPGAYFVAAWWGHGFDAAPGARWLPLVAMFAVFSARDALPAVRARRIPRDDAILQGLNASLAVVAGWFMTARLHPEALGTFYFGAAAILLVVGVLWRRLDAASPLAAFTFCQVGALAALGWMEQFDGTLRSLVLLAQACVLLVAGRLAGLRPLRFIALLVWLGAWVQFITTTRGTIYPAMPPLLAWLFCSGVLLAFDQRWFGSLKILSYAGGALLGLAALRAGLHYRLLGWAPAWSAGAAVLVLAAGLPARRWRSAAVATGVSLFAAELALGFYPPRAFPPWQLWTNGAAIVLAVVLVGAAWDRIDRRDSTAGRRWRTVLAVTAALVLQLVFWDGLRHAQDLCCTAFSALVLAWASRWVRRWPLTIAGTMGLAYALWLQGPFRVRPDFPLLFLAAALAWALPVMLQLSPSRREALREDAWRRVLPWIQSVLAVWITLLGVLSNASGEQRWLVAAIEALAVFWLAWKLGLRPAWAASSLLLFAAASWVAGALVFHRLADAGAYEIGTVAGLVAVALALPLIARQFAAGVPLAMAQWAHGVLGLALLFWFLAAQETALADYATVGWGGAAIAVFLAGLFLRARTYRLIGLAGLLVCVPRVFLVDLDSTFPRIIAFVVLGLVLLWVGFSYHRFRHFITGEPPAPAEPPKLL